MEQLKYFKEENVTYLEPIKRSSTDLFLCYCGTEKCLPSHSYGPTIRSEYLIHYIIDGEGVYTARGKTYHLKKHDGFLILPGEVTSYEANPKNPWTYIWIAINGLKAEHYLNYAHLNEQHLIFTCLDETQLLDYHNQMLELNQYNYANELKLQGLTYQFLSCLASHNQKPALTCKASASEVYLEKSLQYIHNNFATELKVTDIANFIGINRSYLTHIFKEKLKTSPKEYLLNFRLERACQLLIKTDLPITQIAKGVGYQDPFTFSKIFRKYIGCSPSSYRQNKKLVE